MSRKLVLLLSFAILAFFFLQFRPIDDVDCFWQLRRGIEMLDGGPLSGGDSWTYTHHGEPVPAIAWLAQWLYAVVYRYGSWAALRGLNALVFAAALLVAGLTVKRSDSGSFSLLAALALGLLVALPHTSLRPQAFAALGFALLLWIATAEKLGAWRLVLAVPLLLLWQNLHPSVMVGAIAVGGMAAGRWLQDRKQGIRRWPWTLFALVVLVAASQFATPLGGQIINLTQINTRVSRDWLRITEWMPPWDASVRYSMVSFWLALPLSLALLWRLRFRVPLDQLGLFAVMTLLVLTASRFGLFWSIALVPLWARWIERAKPAGFFADAAMCYRPKLAMPVLALGLLAAAVTPTLFGATLFSRELPLEGIRRLSQILPEGRIYNYREWGGPLIMAGAPRWQIAIDGRLYLFILEDWTEYNAASLGEVPVSELVQRHHPDAFFLRPTFHQGLIARLRQEPAWHEEYADENCSIFVPSRSHDAEPN